MKEQEVKNFKIYSGLRSFQRIGESLLMIKDLETGYSISEDYGRVYDVLELLLTSRQFDMFKKEYTSGNIVYFDFNKMKLYLVQDNYSEDSYLKELSTEVVLSRLQDEGERKNYFFDF